MARHRLLTIYRSWVKHDPQGLGFGPWVVATEGTIVGSAGFQGTARDDATIELGSGIHSGRGDQPTRLGMQGPLRIDGGLIAKSVRATPLDRTD